MIRCPDCGAEIDVDEDEVEEGEILSFPECEWNGSYRDASVHLNPISDDLDEEDDEDEEEEEDDSKEDDDEEDVMFEEDEEEDEE